MAMQWSKIEPLFLSAIFALVGWIAYEVVHQKADIAVVKEKISAVQLDITEIKTDIHKMLIADVDNNDTKFVVKFD
jgi:hypothetical protein